MTDTGRSDSLSRLESLPLSLLESICTFVALGETKRHSLFSLSLISRKCCSATVRERFRLLQITVSSRDTLLADVRHWQQALGHDHRAACVRVVKIRGSMAGADAAHKTRNSQDDEDEDYEYEFQGGGGGECKPPNGMIPFNMHFNAPTEDEKAIANDAWQALAALVRTLSGLQDLVYSSKDQIPKCLLAALHEDCPPAIDADELTLATSPSLYSMVAASAMYDAAGNVDYNLEAVLRLVSGLAPRLAQLRYWYMDPGGSRAADRAYMTPRPPWQGFPADGPGAQQSRGRLQSLFLGGCTVTTLSVLQTWSLRTDFRQLRSLSLQCSMSLGALLELGHMATAGELEAVRFLSLRVSPAIHDEKPNMDQAVGELLQTLHCLESLCLSGYIGDKSMDAILKHHAEGLRRLEFVPVQRGAEDGYVALTSWHALELSRRGHSLKTLKISVPRQGCREEVSIYQALGRLPRLKSLDLRLACPVEHPLPPDDQLDEIDDALSLGNRGLITLSSLREAFMSAAVDADLAVQIFRLVSAHNSLHTLKTSPERLAQLRGQSGPVAAVARATLGGDEMHHARRRQRRRPRSGRGRKSASWPGD